MMHIVSPYNPWMVVRISDHFRSLFHTKHHGTWWTLFNMSLNATPKPFILKYKTENAAYLILVLNVEADHLLYTSASGFNLTT